MSERQFRANYGYSFYIGIIRQLFHVLLQPSANPPSLDTFLEKSWPFYRLEPIPLLRECSPIR